MEENKLTDEEINALVQYEAGNREYFRMDEDKAAEIRAKVQSNDINQARYKESKEIYLSINRILKKRSKFNPYAVAAALLFLFSFSFVFIYFESQKLVKDGSGGSIAAGPAVDTLGSVLSDEELLAEHYRPNEELENYVNYALRDIVRLEAMPKKGTVLNTTVNVSWAGEGISRLTLKLFDNKGALIRKEENRSSPIPLSELKVPGLYYWSLENDEEVIYWSKFYLK